MAISPEERRAFYARQASFTRGIRLHIYRIIGLANLADVLEVGCGTGAVLNEIGARCSGRIVGLDSDIGLLAPRPPGDDILSVGGVASSLPLADSSFDAVLTHFLFMWLSDPAAAVKEMKRVVRQGGWIVALAEPDYGGWIDHPEGIDIGRKLADALRSEGADPMVGRKLRSIFVRAGLEPRVGLSPNMWDSEKLKGEFENEWGWRFKLLGRSEDSEAARAREQQAIDAGVRLLYMPIFYAIARNP